MLDACAYRELSAKGIPMAGHAPVALQPLPQVLDVDDCPPAPHLRSLGVKLIKGGLEILGSVLLEEHDESDQQHGLQRATHAVGEVNQAQWGGLGALHHGPALLRAPQEVPEVK